MAGPLSPPAAGWFQRRFGALRVLYVSPLTALGTDIRENLPAPLAELKFVDLAGEFQHIGLTATVRPPEAEAAFLGDFTGPGIGGEGTGDLVPRPVTVVAPPAQMEIVLSVEALPAKREGPPDADGLWKDIAERLRHRIRKNPSTLAFIDSRKWSEKLARIPSAGEDDGFAWAHHGSLSKDMRRLVETRLKEGRIKEVVATGSLDLGIDIGPPDEVALIGAPSSASTALQRRGSGP